jgi:DNA helicase-2/ATP-dependent DNA helicase PcrA
MERIWSDNQKAIFDYVKNEKGNLVISAKAGASKTTSIVESINHIPRNEDGELPKIIFLAFNKHIVEELKKRVPKGVYVTTTHALGYYSLKRKYGKDVKVNERKVYDYLFREISGYNIKDLTIHSKGDYKEYIGNICKMINLTRLTVALKKEQIKVLSEKQDIKLTDLDYNIILKVLEKCYNDVKQIDFSDMLFLPAIKKDIFIGQYDYVFFDEGQDANKCQQVMVKKLLKNDGGRFIVVGDESQMITGFAGADSFAFQNFMKQPNTKVLTLPVSYRCAKSIIREAQKIVPDIQAWEHSPEGVVRKDGDVLSEVENGDWVLCRKVSPLISLFFQLLDLDKKAIIKGRDIAKVLISTVSEYRKNGVTINSMIADLRNKLTQIENKLLERGIYDFEEQISYQEPKDNFDILSFLSKKCVNLLLLEEKIDQIFDEDTEGITLSTVHKMKGLEANRVFIIKPELLPMKCKNALQYKEEMNLKYVSITRAKSELIYDEKWTEIMMLDDYKKVIETNEKK